MVALYTTHQLCNLLLHCEIGVGNVIFELLGDIINEYIEIYAPGEEAIQTAVPVLKEIITDTAKQRDEWDDSPNGNIWKTLRHAVATHQKRRPWLVVASEEESNEQEVTYCSNVIQLKNLQVVWDALMTSSEKHATHWLNNKHN
jgi:hypothetical protein